MGRKSFITSESTINRKGHGLSIIYLVMQVQFSACPVLEKAGNSGTARTGSVNKKQGYEYFAPGIWLHREVSLILLKECFMAKGNNIDANGLQVEVRYGGAAGDFISLTDIAKYRTAENPGYVIQNWMRTRNTVRFLGLWEHFHNPEFNYLEFEAIEREAGLNSFVLTPKRWVEQTGAKGIVTKQGRYAATFAHQDIAFEFASWISPEFKLYIVKDHQRLKSEENSRLSLGWNRRIRRTCWASFS